MQYARRADEARTYRELRARCHGAGRFLRLESAGCLTVHSVEHSGRLRKFYHITELGRKQLRDFADSWGELEAMYEFIRGGLEDEQS